MALIQGESLATLRDRRPLVRNTLANLACLLLGTIAVAVLVRVEMSLGGILSLPQRCPFRRYLPSCFICFRNIRIGGSAMPIR